MYRLVVDDEAIDQLAEIPSRALRECARALDILELAPWNGRPHHEANPHGAVRQWLFGPEGAGQIVYLVLEEPREVHVLQVRWLDS